MEFMVQGVVTVSCWTKVEANTMEDAIYLAKQRLMAEVTFDGSYPEDEYWHIDADGEPHDVRTGDD